MYFSPFGKGRRPAGQRDSKNSKLLQIRIKCTWQVFQIPLNPPFPKGERDARKCKMQRGQGPTSLGIEVGPWDAGKIKVVPPAGGLNLVVRNP